MARFKDITGQKFGMLLAIKRVSNIGEDDRWFYRCDCGSEVEKLKRNVNKSPNASCGCINPKFIDRTGQKFGKLTALRLLHKKTQTKEAVWLCRCDCGKTKEVIISNAINGNTVSCGCFRKEVNSAFTDLTNERIGNIVVLKRTDKKSKSGWLWLCRCDCGKSFNAPANELTRKRKRHCGCRIGYKAENNPKWKGGRIITSSGYILIHAPEHPFRSSKGYVLEHRLVMEKTLGRTLLPNENVHHINGVRDDNRPENLELWVTSQPSGQRPEDLIAHSLEILKLYAPEMLSVQGAYSFAL